MTTVFYQLAVQAPRVLTGSLLLERVWGLEHSEDRRTVRTYMKRLRRSPGEEASIPQYIFAGPRVDYRVERPDARAEAEGQK